jgi:hypothetical protein
MVADHCQRSYYSLELAGSVATGSGVVHADEAQRGAYPEVGVFAMPKGSTFQEQAAKLAQSARAINYRVVGQLMYLRPSRSAHEGLFHSKTHEHSHVT